jgi:glycosyltransferase involved in cell wall biosynthesis
MLLSIVIPTFNRLEMLTETVRLLEREISWLPVELKKQVEFIVVDNASNDGTRESMDGTGSGVCCYKYFPEHLNIAGSIARSIALANGRYVWVFGDDDYIPGGFVRDVVERLMRIGDDTAFVYFNRIVVDWKFRLIKTVAHQQWSALEESMPMGDFIRRYSHWPGFVTSMVFLRQSYENGADFDKPEYDGWGFLARIYSGGCNRVVSVVNFPSLAQRLGVHAWKASWPRYWLVNMPRLLSDLEAAGMTKGAVAYWREHEVSLKRILIDAVVAKAVGIGAKDAFWCDALRWQCGLRRVILTSVRWLVPCWLGAAVYRLQPKYRK